MLDRRTFLQMAGCAGLGALLPGCAGTPPLPAARFPSFGDPARPYLGLATSLPDEHDYEAQVQGRIPAAVRGVLYRNGPGLFERGGERKRSLLDGDGMIQRFVFHGDGVRFTNRFVRTAKFKAEAAADRFLYPTWSTTLPGGVWGNFWAAGRIACQAGVTVFPFNGRLYAFDESSLPYALDPVTLETIGPSRLGLPEGEPVLFSAHAKFDPASGEWLHFGIEYGPRPLLHLVAIDRSGREVRHRTLPLPRFVYIHDWFVSPRYLVLCLHPLEIEYWGLLLGTRSVIESLRWRPEEGNLVMVIPRDGTGEPLLIPAPASYLWHTINAWEEGEVLAAEFVGYANPDHFVGSGAVAEAVMAGRGWGRFSPGVVRRYLLNPGRLTAREEIVAAGNFEWPRIHEGHRGRNCRYAYLAAGKPGEFFWSGISRLDLQSGAIESFDFGPGRYVTEPVFVPVPGRRYEPLAREEPGWLLTEVYDSGSRQSYLALLDAGMLAEGPVAEVRLRHHVPFSYHGWWQAAS